MLQLNIKTIVENGDSFERSFFKWMASNNINWKTNVYDLNYIILNNINDYCKIVEIWSEVSLE